MQFEIKIDQSYKIPKVIVITASLSDEVAGIIKQFSSGESQIISGYKDEKVEILNHDDIITIYASNGKVYARTKKGSYVLRLKLYEAEGRVASKHFVRISNSEIINLSKVESFDFSFSGTICVKLSDGTHTYVSRRHVSSLKEILGL